jgi:hypothetical protein
MPHTYASLNLARLDGPADSWHRTTHHEGVPVEKLDWSRIPWGLREAIRINSRHRYSVFLPDGTFRPADTPAEVDAILATIPDHAQPIRVFVPVFGGLTIQFD